MRQLRFLPAAALLATLAWGAQDAPTLKLEKGDHISIIGNTTADRMQHAGWLETFLQSRFPRHELVIRNLGFSADELTIRLRSANFGSPDQWLAKNQTDVVFAFFGYNESFAGEAGLPKFKTDLESFIKSTLGQKYNGKSAPRLVLFSPLAHENLKDPNLPDGAQNNKRLELYSQVMAEVAKAANVTFVDLFHPAAKLYAEASRPLTINGIHLNDEGDKKVASAIDRALFSEAAPARESAQLEKIRQAVLDKNFHWFNRYRTTDGFSVFGGRADLKFTNGQTNRVVAQRELEVLDEMTANRDPKIWAAARGKDYKVDDSNTQPFIAVPTNKPGAGPDGAHVFLGGEEAIAKMTVAPGMKINLFASEEKFPELVSTQQMQFDTKGRLWCTAWPSYTHWKPKDEMNDKLLIFEDTDGDGKADKCTVFADHLHNPTGFEFWNGGVIVAMAPDILFLKDTDGDDKADVRERIISGMDSADTHHTSNSFVLDPGGAMYWQEGTFHHTQVETPYGAPQRCANAGVFRYEPRTQKFEVYVSFGFANPHGHAFDRWGQDFVTDGTGADTYDALTFSGHLDFPRKHGRPPKPYQQRTRPCPGTEFLTSRHFPEENQGNFLVANVIGFQGILQYRWAEKGSGSQGTETTPIVSSTDPNFRPSDLKIGPDGAIYFTDWQNPIIGHMQHNLRDPSRDHAHGRIYRVTCPGRPLLQPLKIAGEPVVRLLDLLKEPEDRVRQRVRIELSGRKTEEVIPAARKWMAGLDKEDKDYEHHMLEALWLHQSHNVVYEDLLKRELRCAEPHARAAATRVLRYWRDRVPGVLDLLAVQANDEHPRVRLEAVIACSYFEDPKAAMVALECLKRPHDESIDFGLKETMTQLDSYWKAAVREGRLNVSADNPAAAEFLLSNVTTAELLKLPKTAAVQLAILTRMGVPADARREALSALAKEMGVDEINLLLDVITRLESGLHRGHVSSDLARLLIDRPADTLFRAGDRIMTLASSGPYPEARQIGYAAWVTFLGTADAPYGSAEKTEQGLRDFLAAIPLIGKAELRGALYPKIKPLAFEIPAHLKKPGEDAPSAPGRGLAVDYYEQRTPNVAIETVSKLKPTSSGTAGSISVDLPIVKAHGAQFILRFSGTLMVPKEGSYTFFTGSDDGSRLYVDGKMVVNNDGLHGMEEKSGKVQLPPGAHALVVTYFNNGGGEGLQVAWQGPGFAKQTLGASALGGEADTIQDAAIRTLPSISGHEKEAFADLASLILEKGKVRTSVFQAVLQIDRKQWAADKALPLVNAILGYASALPAEQRTTPSALDALRLGEDLAGLLPKEDGEHARAMLKNLGVSIIVIRPIRDQMLFDRRQFSVEAGKSVEIVFDNVDIMPHNFVITAPGSMIEVGQMAEKMGPPGEVKSYIPDTPKVLFSTKLLLPGQYAKLQFTAPAKAGSYPYVCTFPGHYLIMNGVMNVVEKGAPVPASILVTAPPSSGPNRKFVKMWTTADLENDAKSLSGRSFAKGRELFTAAGCIKCHTLAGEGSKLGPDLTKVSEKYKGEKLLRQIIEPSSEINDQFRAQVFQTSDGDVVAGMVVKEDAQAVHVVTNLLLPNEVKIIPKDKISARKPSELSPMPTGMLVTLQKDEILDLVAYLESGGDPKYKAFGK
jgi:putative heme-binding domain-containing protein